MFDRELLKGSTSLLVLQLLQERPMYGYEIVQVLGDRSAHALNVKEGTLYPALHKLEIQGYVESFWQQQDKGKPRKYYKLTAEGESKLGEKTKEWTQFSNLINSMLGKTT